MTHVDGDDYTWAAGPVQAAAVFIPDAEPGTAAAWVERWQRQAQQAGMKPDLRTADAKERDDVAELRQRIEALEAAMKVLDVVVTTLVNVLEVRL